MNRDTLHRRALHTGAGAPARFDAGAGARFGAGASSSGAVVGAVAMTVATSGADASSVFLSGASSGVGVTIIVPWLV